jgi:uncharacterized membrane protein YebE (DUF533 family)
MGESQILSVIRIWAAIAWADGKLAEAEAEGLRRLIGSGDLAEQERAAANAMLAQKTELPTTYLSNMAPDARRGVYRAACRMAMVDHVFAASERAMLDKLRAQLGVPADIALEIEADVPGLS